MYQDWRTEWFPTMAQEMLAEFHAKHLNIRVCYVPDSENLGGKMLVDARPATEEDE